MSLATWDVLLSGSGDNNVDAGAAAAECVAAAGNAGESEQQSPLLHINSLQLFTILCIQCMC